MSPTPNPSLSSPLGEICVIFVTLFFSLVFSLTINIEITLSRNLGAATSGAVGRQPLKLGVRVRLWCAGPSMKSVGDGYGARAPKERPTRPSRSHVPNIYRSLIPNCNYLSEE